MKSVIGIDLGSNTLRVVKLNCSDFTRVCEFEKIVKTGDKLHESGIISNEAKDRIIEAILQAKEKIIFDSEIIAVTTEAFRSAKNSNEILNEIEQKTKIKFKIIDGESEAKFTTLAVKNALKRLNYQDNNFLLVDIGGGSSEIIIDGVISKSFKLGIIPIAQKYKTKENIEKNLEFEFKEIKKFIDESYKKFDKPNFFVATAGTPTTILAMKLGLDYEHYDYKKVSGNKLEINDLDEQLNKLLKVDLKERERLVGVGRSDLIVAGVLIFKELLKITNFNSSIVIDDGLREGVAIAKCLEII